MKYAFFMHNLKLRKRHVNFWLVFNFEAVQVENGEKGRDFYSDFQLFLTPSN